MAFQLTLQWECYAYIPQFKNVNHLTVKRFQFVLISSYTFIELWNQLSPKNGKKNLYYAPHFQIWCSVKKNASSVVKNSVLHLRNFGLVRRNMGLSSCIYMKLYLHEVSWQLIIKQQNEILYIYTYALWNNTCVRISVWWFCYIRGF